MTTKDNIREAFDWHKLGEIAWEAYKNSDKPAPYNQVLDAVKAATNEQQKLLDEAVEPVLIGGNHLASALWGITDPLSISNYDDALHKHGQPYADMWVAWKAIMGLAKLKQARGDE